MSLVKDEHNKCLRQSLKRFYEEEMLTDVVINVSGRKFKCHRIILASLSVYYETLFHSQFIDAQEKELTLQVDGSTFEEVINFMYCRTDTINTLNAENLFKIADFLQIESLKEVLEQQLLKDLSVENCLEWFRLADLYNCPRLLEKSLSMTAGNFGSVFDNDQFLLLSSNLICNVLSKTNLSVPSEENIFEAVVKWYRADIKGRKSSLSFILEQIRFPQMSLGYLEKVGKESFMKPLSRLRLIEEAKNYQSNPHLRHTYSSIRTIPRHYQEEVNMFCILGCMVNKKKDGTYSQTYPTVHMFDLKASKWYRLNYALHDKIGNCTNFAACPYDNGLYMSGTPRDSKGFTFFDVRNKVLMKRRQMNMPRMFHCLVAMKDKIYALGGMNLDDDRLASVEMFSFNKKGPWQTVGYLPISVSDMSACIYKDKIYVFGGLTDDTEDPVIQCFDTKENIGYIVECTNIPDRFVMPKSLLCDNRIILVCGDGTVHEFFPEESRFQEIGKIQSFLKKHYYGCVQFGGSIFVFGGVGSSHDVISFDLKSKLTKYHSPLSPSTCVSVYCGFYTSTKLSGLTALN